MKTLILSVALALTLIAGTVTVLTFHPHVAYADCGGGGC